jgi:hypothetical protein
MTTIHTRQLTTIHTRHLKIQHVQKVSVKQKSPQMRAVFIFAVICQMLCNKGRLFFVKSTGKVVIMHTMQAQGRVELQHRLFLTSSLGGSEWSSSHSSHFTLKEGVLCTLRVVGWGSLSTRHHDGYHHGTCNWKRMCWCHSQHNVKLTVFTWHWSSLIVADSTVEDVLCTVDPTRLMEGTKLLAYLYHLACTEYVCLPSISGSSLVKNYPKNCNVWIL